MPFFIGFANNSIRKNWSRPLEKGQKRGVERAIGPPCCVAVPFLALLPSPSRRRPRVVPRGEPIGFRSFSRTLRSAQCACRPSSRRSKRRAAPVLAKGLAQKPCRRVCSRSGSRRNVLLPCSGSDCRATASARSSATRDLGGRVFFWGQVWRHYETGAPCTRAASRPVPPSEVLVPRVIFRGGPTCPAARSAARDGARRLRRADGTPPPTGDGGYHTRTRRRRHTAHERDRARERGAGGCVGARAYVCVGVCGGGRVVV